MQEGQRQVLLLLLTNLKKINFNLPVSSVLAGESANVAFVPVSLAPTPKRWCPVNSASVTISIVLVMTGSCAAATGSACAARASASPALRAQLASVQFPRTLALHPMEKFVAATESASAGNVIALRTRTGLATPDLIATFVR